MVGLFLGLSHYLGTFIDDLAMKDLGFPKTILDYHSVKYYLNPSKSI